jgi:DNA anti-recombination protein RmuC
MQTAILILLAVVLLVLLWLALQSQRKTSDPAAALLQQEVQSLRGQLSDAMLKSQAAVNQQLGQITSQVNAQLGQVTQQLQKSTGDLNTRLDNAARVVQEVSKGLGSLSEATQKVFLVGRDIAGLHEILRAPKLRGGLGELFLGDLLAQIFPPAHYTLQHRFKSPWTRPSGSDRTSCRWTPSSPSKTSDASLRPRRKKIRGRRSESSSQT